MCRPTWNYPVRTFSDLVSLGNLSYSFCGGLLVPLEVTPHKILNVRMKRSS